MEKISFQFAKKYVSNEKLRSIAFTIHLTLPMCTYLTKALNFFSLTMKFNKEDFNLPITYLLEQVLTKRGEQKGYLNKNS